MEQGSRTGFEFKNGPKCALHGRQIALICFKDSCTDSRLICDKCFMVNQPHFGHSAIFLDEFLPNPYLLLEAYPALANLKVTDLLKSDGAAMKKCYQKLELEVDARFDELLIVIEEELNNVRAKMKSQIVELSKLECSIQNQVKALVDVSKIKNLLEEDWKDGLKKFQDALNSLFETKINEKEITSQLSSFNTGLNHVKGALEKEEGVKLVKEILRIIENCHLISATIENRQNTLTAASGLIWNTGSPFAKINYDLIWNFVTTAELTPPFCCSVRVTGPMYQRGFTLGLTDKMLASFLPGVNSYERMTFYANMQTNSIDSIGFNSGPRKRLDLPPFEGELLVTIEVDSARKATIRVKETSYTEQLSPTMKIYIIFGCFQAPDIEALIL